MFVADTAHLRGSFAIQGIFNLNHQQGFGALAQLERLGNQRGKFGINNQRLGFAMVQHEGDGLGVQAGVQGIEHGPGHGHAKVRLNHRWRVGQDNGDRVIFANAGLLQGMGQLAAAGISLRPGLAQSTVHDGQTLGVNAGRAL